MLIFFSEKKECVVVKTKSHDNLTQKMPVGPC